MANNSRYNEFTKSASLLVTLKCILGGFMKRQIVSTLGRIALPAFLVMVFLPVSTFAQRRWVVVRPHRNRVVIYQPRPDVIYQRQPAYSYRYNTDGYSQPYYSTQYYSNGYNQPYYTSQYYSSGYTQPYYVNPYAGANSNYRYRYYGYQPRYRSNGFGVRIRLR